MKFDAKFTDEIIIPVIPVSQQGNTFYIGKFKAKDLLRIATVHVRNPESNRENKYIEEVTKKLGGALILSSSPEGIQRITQLKRLKDIAEYIKSDGILPSTILISINSKKVDLSEDEVDEEDFRGFKLVPLACQHNIAELHIDAEQVDAFIVDGQHRLAAFAYARENIKNFELPVTIFLEMELPLQAELFSKINGTQKPVNKSLLYDLSEISPSEYGEIKTCHAIAKWFNSNKSPFYQRIKMVGNDEGSISQSAFIDALIPFVKKRKSRKERAFMSEMTNTERIALLNSYFSTISRLYTSEWSDTKNYILTRTTGFGALMKLLYYVYIFMRVEEMPFEERNLYNTLMPMKAVADFSAEGIAGQGAQTALCKTIREKLFGGEKGVEILEDRYRHKFS